MTGLAARQSPPPFSAALRRLGPRLPRALAKAKRPGTIERILRAAETIFADRGLDGARTDAIARAARVNHALLYYYFRGKQDLHRFTLELLFSQLRDQMGATLARPTPPPERLFGYVNAFFDFVVLHPNYPRLVQRLLMSRGPGLAGIVNEFYRPLHDRLSATIRAGVARGEFREVDARQTALTLVATTVFYFVAAPVVGELWRCDPLAPSRIAARRRAVLDFLEHGLFAPSARKR